MNEDFHGRQRRSALDKLGLLSPMAPTAVHPVVAAWLAASEPPDAPAPAAEREVILAALLAPVPRVSQTYLYYALGSALYVLSLIHI